MPTSSSGMEVLHTYISHHSKYQLLQEGKAICQRKFNIINIRCHVEGNTILKAADDFLWAIVMNRTALLQVTVQSCSNSSIFAKDWMISLTELIPLWQKYKCEKQSELSSWNDPSISEIEYLQNDGCYQSEFGMDETAIRFCQIANWHINRTFIGPAAIPALENTRVGYYTFHEGYGVTDFPSSWKHRFHQITSTSFDIGHHWKANVLITQNKSMISWNQYENKFASNIESIRGFMTYGRLTNMIFEFHPFVLEHNREVLGQLYGGVEGEMYKSKASPSLNMLLRRRVEEEVASPSSSSQSPPHNRHQPILSPFHSNNTATTRIIFGVHARHQTNEHREEDRLDVGLLACVAHNIKTVLSLHANNATSSNTTKNKVECFILLSTDRNNTLNKLEPIGKELQCTILYSPKVMKTAAPESDLYEHGPWGDSAMSSMDTEFLSHAQYLIGMKRSTFSMLLASLVAARHDLHNHGNLARSHNTSHVLHSALQTYVKHPYLWAVDEPCSTDDKSFVDNFNILNCCKPWIDSIPPFKAYDNCSSNPATFVTEKRQCERTVPIELNYRP